LQKVHHILVVEDSKADLFLIREAIAAAGVEAVLDVVTDGQAAVQFLESADGATRHCPDLVLLDLNIPKKDGAEVLRHLRSNPTCKNALVVIVTSSDSTRDREAVNALGTEGYFRKPSSIAEFLKLGTLVKDLLRAQSTESI
jgi:CheY-like chemotaxis protein